jgi:hypothetical protein
VRVDGVVVLDAQLIQRHERELLPGSDTHEPYPARIRSIFGRRDGGRGGGAYLWSVVADGDADARQADGERELLLPPLLHSDEHRTRTHIQTLCNTQVTE